VTWTTNRWRTPFFASGPKRWQRQFVIARLSIISTPTLRRELANEGHLASHPAPFGRQLGAGTSRSGTAVHHRRCVRLDETLLNAVAHPHGVCSPRPRLEAAHSEAHARPVVVIGKLEPDLVQR
jgi:hypothetical protein